MEEGLNDSEQFVAALAKRTFLSLWSYVNPRGRAPNKELCDVLAVCAPHIVVFSVKDVRMTGDGEVERARWARKAVDASIKQLYGAQRVITDARCAVRLDGSLGVSFPPASERCVHLVAIALGADSEMPLVSGEYGSGIVHVMSGPALNVILSELDTVTDLTNYLHAKEAALSNAHLVVSGGEENLVAWYLAHDRTFPNPADVLAGKHSLWSEFVAQPQVEARKTADRLSYFWDQLIDLVGGDMIRGELEMSHSLDQDELAIRVMARESRLGRRMLSKALLSFLDGQTKEDGVRARITSSPSDSDVGYVFLARPLHTPREERRQELTMRCFVARGELKSRSTWVGIATETREGQTGESYDLVYFRWPAWSAEDESRASRIKRELGYFRNPRMQSTHEEEYPAAD